MKQRHTSSIIALLLLVTLLAAACAPVAAPAPTEPPAPIPTAAPPTTEPPAPTAEPQSTGTSLSVTGLVGTELSLTEADLRALDVANIEAEHPKKGMQSYSGVRLSVLMAQAQVKPEATTLVLTASDGFSAEIDLPTVIACADCMVAFTDTPGSFLAVMPGQSSKAWVKDLITLEFK